MLIAGEVLIAPQTVHVPHFAVYVSRLHFGHFISFSPTEPFLAPRMQGGTPERYILSPQSETRQHRGRRYQAGLEALSERYLRFALYFLGLLIPYLGQGNITIQVIDTCLNLA